MKFEPVIESIIVEEFGLKGVGILWKYHQLDHGNNLMKETFERYEKSRYTQLEYWKFVKTMRIICDDHMMYISWLVYAWEHYDKNTKTLKNIWFGKVTLKQLFSEYRTK